MSSLSIQNSRCLNYAIPLGSVCTAVSGAGFGYLVVTGIPFAGIVPIISYVAAAALGGVGLFFLSYAFFARNHGASSPINNFPNLSNYRPAEPTPLSPSSSIQTEPPTQSQTRSNHVFSSRSPTTALLASSQIANNPPFSNGNPPITLLSTHHIARPSKDQGAGFAASSVSSHSSSASSSSSQDEVDEFALGEDQGAGFAASSVSSHSSSASSSSRQDKVDEFALGNDHDYKHNKGEDYATPIEEIEVLMSNAGAVPEKVSGRTNNGQGVRINKGKGSKTKNARRKWARKQASKKKAAQREAAAKKAADLAAVKAAEKAAKRAAAARPLWKKATDAVSSIASSGLNAVAPRMPGMPQLPNLFIGMHYSNTHTQ